MSTTHQRAVTVESPPATVPDRILAFGGVWFFFLFLLQAVAEFTHILPMSLANVAYSLAVAIGVTAVSACWRTTGHV
jgi:hypothetical protein